MSEEFNMGKLELVEKFSIDFDDWGCEDGKLVDRANKTKSSLYIYFKDFLLAPSGTMDRLERASYPSLAAMINRDETAPDVFRQVGQEFYDCLYEAEKTYDFETVKAMWSSIGITLDIRRPRPEKPKVQDVLEETSDVILAPVLYSLNGNKNLSAFQVKVCLVSNSGSNVDTPTTAVILDDFVNWEGVVEDCVWTCSNTEGHAGGFVFPWRLKHAAMKKDSAAYIQAMATMLTHEGYTVWCPFRKAPVKSRTRWGDDGKLQTIPRYEWNKYNLAKPQRIDPIEPWLMRDFIMNGDQRVRLEGAILKHASPVAQWEKDDEFFDPPF